MSFIADMPAPKLFVMLLCFLSVISLPEHAQAGLKIDDIYFGLAGNVSGFERDGDQDADKKGREKEKEKEKNDRKEEKQQEKNEKREEKIKKEYERLRAAGREKLKENVDFKQAVDESFKELRRQHSELGFKINTYDSRDERITFTGDKLKTEDTLYDNPLVQDYINRVGQSLVPPQSNIRYAFKVILNPVPDARTYSTGTVYITTGLLSLIDNEAQLAYILGHEIGHNEKNHWYDDSLVAQMMADEDLKRDQKSKMITGIAGIATAGLIGIGGGGIADSILGGRLAATLARALMKVVNPSKVFSWDKLQEDEADGVGFDLMFSRNYDPREIPKLYTRIRKFAEKDNRVSDGFLAQIDRIAERSVFIDERLGKTTVKPNLFRGASNLRAKREETDVDLVSPLEAGKVFGVNDDATRREKVAAQKISEYDALLKQKLAKGEILGSRHEFESVMADLKRDNGVRAFYYDMFNMSIENLRESLDLRSNDPYTHFFYGKVLNQTAHSPEEKAQSMESFNRAIELDQRRTISGPWIYRALSLMADNNPTLNEEIVVSLKSYVEIYQQEHAGDLPPNMDAIYAYLKNLGEETWVARPATNISTRNIDPIRILDSGGGKGATPTKPEVAKCSPCPGAADPTPRTTSITPPKNPKKPRSIN